MHSLTDPGRAESYSVVGGSSTSQKIPGNGEIDYSRALCKAFLHWDYAPRVAAVPLVERRIDPAAQFFHPDGIA